ncbi:beta-lactamase family protein [Burkholderiaceae bacterium DAT-1]|nr:beta-lactamase family protein [Burkholderiaceae bacterium DAT-1]
MNALLSRMLGTALVTLACFSSLSATELDSKSKQAIHDIVGTALKKHGTPSVSVAIVTDNEVAFTGAWGKASLNPVRDAKPDMRYAIGSVSKQFTAAALLMLEADGKLSLDDKVSRYLPDMGAGGEATIRQLLAHTSGMRDYWPQDYVFRDMLTPVTADQIIDRFARQPLDFAPGERWQYSNTGYVVAGKIFEQVAGEPLLSFLQRRVFKPLNMLSAMDFDQHTLDAHDPVPYTGYLMGPIQQAPRAGEGWMFAAGALAMTAEDLAKWDISLMRESLMPHAQYAAFTREVLLNNGAGSQYGLGLSVKLKNESRVLSHGGEVSGFVSSNTVYPDKHLAVVVLTNSDANNAAASISEKIEEMLLKAGAPTDEAMLQQAKAIFTQLQQGKIDRTLFSDNGNHYFNETVLKQAMTSLGSLGKVKSFEQVRTSTRGGMTNRAFKVKADKGNVKVLTRTWINGPIEQFTVSPD